MVTRKNVGDEFADVIVDGASLFNRGSDRAKVIPCQNDVRGLLSNIRSNDAHGDAHVRFAHRGCIVHSIAGDGYYFAARLKG